MEKKFLIKKRENRKKKKHIIFFFLIFIDMEKLCITCGEIDTTKFYSKRKNKCKVCMSNEYKNRPDREDYINKQKKWRDSNLIHYRVESAKHRAIRKGLLFEITDEIVQQKLKQQDGKCYISKQPLSMVENDWYGISLDRLDNSLGYTIDNTILVTKFVNSSKNILSYDEYIKLLKEVCNNI